MEKINVIEKPKEEVRIEARMTHKERTIINEFCNEHKVILSDLVGNSIRKY